MNYSTKYVSFLNKLKLVRVVICDPFLTLLRKAVIITGYLCLYNWFMKFKVHYSLKFRRKKLRF